MKVQRFRGRVPPLYPLTRAHEVDSATRWGRHLAAVADSIFAQFGSGPRRSLRRSAERPARAAWAALRHSWSTFADSGRRWSSGARGAMPMMMVWCGRGAGELRGHRQQAALKDQRFRGRVPPLYPLTRATGRQRDRGRRRRRVTSVDIGSGPRDRCSVSWAALADCLPSNSFSRYSGSGRTMELGRSGRMPMMMVWVGRGAGELRGHRQQAALKDQRFRGRVPPLYPLTRAHEVDSATRWGRHLAAVADSIFAQFGSGPRRSLRRSAERPARAGWAALQLLSRFAVRGERWSSGVRRRCR